MTFVTRHDWVRRERSVYRTEKKTVRNVALLYEKQLVCSVHRGFNSGIIFVAASFLGRNGSTGITPSTSTFVQEFALESLYPTLVEEIVKISDLMSGG